MLSRRLTAASVVFAAAALGAGCGRPAPPAPSATSIDAQGLERVHFFAGFDERLLSPPRVIPEQVAPAPMAVESLPPEEAAVAVNFEAIVAGLRGRVDALLERQERNVRAREMLSAAAEVEQARERMRPDLDARLRQIEDSLYTSQHNFRIKQAALRQQIEFYRALLRARQRVEPGAGGDALQKQIDSKEQELAALEAQTAQTVAEVKYEAERDQAIASAEFESEIARVQREEREKAQQRVSALISGRRTAALRASNDFVLALRSTRSAPAAPGITGRVAPVKMPPAERSITATDLARLAPSARRVREMVSRDAEVAARVASQVQPPSLVPGQTARSRKTAVQLLGAPTLRRE